MKSITAALMITAASLAHASPLPDYPFVFADGEARENLAPNTCKVAYRIMVRDKDPTNGMQVVEARSAETLALLFKHGVKKEEIVGFEVSKDVVQDYEKRDRLEFLGYEMTRRIEFSLVELQKYEPIVSVLLKTPDVTDIRTSFDRTDRKQIESRLTAEAVSDAKAKAKVMAEGSGQRLVKLRAISQRGFYNLSAPFGLDMEVDQRMFAVSNSQAERPLLFIPSTIPFRNSVSMIYEIEEQK